MSKKVHEEKGKKGKEKERNEENKDLSTVLIVEDNPDNMTTIKAILKGKYMLSEATEGMLGINIVKSQVPDLVLLDMSLPKMNGEEVLRILKNDKKTTEIPVIAVRAMTMKGNKKKILGYGFDGYIAKPIDA